MEFDELKRAWQEYDGKLDTSLHLNRRLLQSSMPGKAETVLKRLSQWLWVEVLLSLVVAGWLGSFVWHHAAQSPFLIPAAVLDLCAIVLVLAGIHQIVAISRMDYSAPVVVVQKQLESLRVERIRTTKWTLRLAPLAWTLLFVVAMKSLFDVDAYIVFGTARLAGSVIFGLLVVAAGIWVSRRYATHVGHNLIAATRFLHSVSEFEGEEMIGKVHALLSRLLRRGGLLRG